jgi:hypothetical protein
VESVSGVDTSTCKPIPLSTDWGRFPAAVGRETSEVLTSVSNESVEAANSVLPPRLRLGTWVFEFGRSRWGRHVTDCLGVASSIPLSTDWGGLPTAACMGRETSETLTTLSNESSEGELENGVLLLPILGTRLLGSE